MSELLEVVLGVDIKSVDSVSDTKVWYTRPGDSLSSFIYTLKLQYKCKEWAMKNAAAIYSTIESFEGYAMISDDAEMRMGTTVAKTEHEAVYQLCFNLIGKMREFKDENDNA